MYTKHIDTLLKTITHSKHTDILRTILIEITKHILKTQYQPQLDFFQLKKYQHFPGGTLIHISLEIHTKHILSKTNLNDITHSAQNINPFNKYHSKISLRISNTNNNFIHILNIHTIIY